MSEELRSAVEGFLKSARLPVLMEAGEDPFPLTPSSFHLTPRGEFLVIECWDHHRNLVRRACRIQRSGRGRIDLEIKKFGNVSGTLTILDQADPSNRNSSRRSSRLKYREQFRRSLRRQFPGWTISELSTEPDLHHSLSPAYPRAFLRRGSAGMAAIGAAADALSPEAVLSFGLIWLDYLRTRERRICIEALLIFVPPVAQVTTCHRIRHLHPQAARYQIFVHESDREDPVEPGDFTNFETRIDPCRAPGHLDWADEIRRIEGVERRERADGTVSFAVRGLEFARIAGDELLFGIDQKIAGSEIHRSEILQLATGLARMRDAAAMDRLNPLYARNPEAWLESQVRAHIEQIDAMLYSAPIYGQVPQFASAERGVIDLLAARRDGCIAVLEIKADQDIHLPLQALDYWMRVRWHLERGEFERAGYFPGIPIGKQAPLLLLVAPALEWHPTNEIILKYFHPEIPAERIGVGLEWRQELRIMFRKPPKPWQSPYFAR